MPRICKVCTHPQRTEIDKRLAFQVVNVAALGREYDVGRKSIENHRNRHLDSFLAAFAASADAPDIGQLNAEVQRLYATTLDAIAKVDAGVLVRVGEHNGEPVYDRRWNPMAFARLVAEARKQLELILKLPTKHEETPAPAKVKNDALDASIAHALARFEERERRALSAHNDVIDVDIVDPDRSD